MGLLVLVRHGQSQWNLENRFTGEVDVDLTAAGEEEAKKAGALLRGYKFDLAFTSVLQRAIRSMEIILAESGNHLVALRFKELNERNYGNLQGLNKEETEKKFGAAQVIEWRRSFDVAPPGGESLKDTYARVIPMYQREIEPALKKDLKILIVAHGNSLRALIMYLQRISPDDIVHLNLSTGMPMVYEMDASLNVVRHYTLS